MLRGLDFESHGSQFMLDAPEIINQDSNKHFNQAINYRVHFASVLGDNSNIDISLGLAINFIL